ncbi:DUF7536 family protein [Natronomonas marina]|uniref:DUF7536 family protein n=1 Tax=Natronomonas marina TaxID=2961939 RepID=UPI0020C9CA2E|nr:hypothetical protein [Natronomonas marina]
MSADTPDRPGVAALAEELEVRRHARSGLLAGAAIAAAVFVIFAYLPGTDESLLYWGALSFVLATAVAGLVTTLLVARAAYRRTLSVNGIDPGRRSPSTLAVLIGLLGWALVPVVATLAVERPSGGFRLLVALVTGGFVALAVGGLGLRVAVALSLSHEWRPREAAAGAVVYTALVAAPAVGCPSGGACLGTPDGLVAAVVGLDPAAVSTVYAAVVLAGGFLVGAALGVRGAAPPHGVVAGVVAAIATLPLVAAASGDPAVVRSTALYLPVLLGTVGGVGGAVVVGIRSSDGSPER